MGADHRAQVDELLAGYRRSRDHLAEVQRALGAVGESATSACGSVTATVSAHGDLTRLDLRDDAYQRYRPTELARVIVEAVASAGARASRAADEIMAPVLPAGTDPAALRRGMADLRPDEVTTPASAPASASASVEEFDFERATWLQSDRQGGS
ncbi:YbaB/EbfC family nucleoid-associated protein [Actinokineospora sp. 24-640]